MIRSAAYCWLTAMALMLVTSCAQTTVEPAADEVLEQTVHLVRATAAPDELEMLDVAIKIFDVDADSRKTGYVGDWIFKEILDIESQYLPTVLRKTLVDSNQWGIVRVLPREDLSMDLTILGTIIRSDGVQLALHIKAIDSAGRQWLDKGYSRLNGLVDEEDPFQDLYEEIANDLLVIRQALSETELQNIQRVTDIRHASDLSPDSFAGLLSTDADGLTRVTRLLADNDPMLQRIARMRFRHNVFIDTLDDYYQVLHLDMRPVYDLWRYYSREQILEVENEIRKDAGRSRNNSGFTAITNNYYRYKAKKLFEQEWIELAEGFTSELKPTILELEDQVYGLTGSVDDQYVQWRKILKDFYLYERGY